MKPRACIVASLMLVSALALVGCKKPTGTFVEGPKAPQYDQELPPGQLALRKITDPAQIPDFTPACSNLSMLRQAIDSSLNYMGKPSSRQFYPYGEISHEQVVASLQAFRALIDQNLTPAQMNEAIRQRFDVYISVGCDNKGTVLFTGYYTPIFNASPTCTGPYRYPIYRQPPGLQKGPDGAILTKLSARRELEASGQLRGLELYWLADPFEVYIAHVQGSAILRLPDGRKVGVGYTANNGWDYVSVGKELIKDGKIEKGKLSLQGMIEYFKAHPNEINDYVNRNPRFVFFAEQQGPPRGSLNEPVTPWRSIATDKAIFPRASIAMLSVGQMPRALSNNTVEDLPYCGFAMDQDTGGAIRAAGRCDVYMGIGDRAGALAGRTYSEGKLYYVFLKPAGQTPSVLPPAAPAGPSAGPVEAHPVGPITQ